MFNSNRFQPKTVIKIACIAFAVFLILDSFFVVSPNQMANVRTMGIVGYEKPLAPGLHFKWPLISTVDRIQVSLETLAIPEFNVSTVDNQIVTLEMNFNYTIPTDKVNHILYEVGRAGNVDIDEQVMAVAKDRAGRIFNGQNMVNVNANRPEIQTEMEKSIFTSVHDLFGIEPHSLQIVAVKPSPAFISSNEAAVKAKNDAVAADNTKRTKQFQADQEVISAKGDADSAIEAANGRAQSVKLEAEAHKASLILEGEGEQSNLKAQISAFGSPELYIHYLQAKAALNWNGTPPQVMAGGSGNGSSGANIVIPVGMAPPAANPAK